MTKQTRSESWKRKSITIASIFLAYVLATPSVLAQVKTPTNGQETARTQIDPRVERLYDEGVQSAENRQWEKARRLLAEAFALDRRPQIAANLGNAELALGRARDAAEHLDYFLREDRTTDADARAEVKAIFDSAALRIVVVSLSVDHDGADLFVNGSPVGKSPMNQRLFLEPGSYTFEAKKHELEPGSQSMVLSRGSAVRVKLKMGETTSVVVLPDGSTRPQAVATARDWRIPWLFGAGGLAAAGIGGGIALFAVGNRNIEDAKQGLADIAAETPRLYASVRDFYRNQPQYSALSKTWQDGRELRGAGTASIVVGSVALVGTFVLIALPKANETNLQLLPTVGQTYAGFIFSGSI